MNSNEGHDEGHDELEKPDLEGPAKERGRPNEDEPDELDQDDGDEDQDEDEDEGRDGDGATVYRHAYVSKLRGEAAAHRANARAAQQLADDRAAELWTFRVDALGVLADPTDLAFDADALDDTDAIRAAAAELVERKPHLRARGIRHRAGQGEGGDNEGSVSLAGMLRRGA